MRGSSGRRPDACACTGAPVERALPALGFEGVANVHVGRLIELDVDDPSQLPQMCQKLLANPLIEDYEILDGY